MAESPNYPGSIGPMRLEHGTGRHTAFSRIGRTGALDSPVNVLVRPGAPMVAELAAAGVTRISVGDAFAFVALGAVIDAAREFLEQGTCGYSARADAGSASARAAFSS